MRTFAQIAACFVLVLPAACQGAPKGAVPVEKISEKKAWDLPAKPAPRKPAVFNAAGFQITNLVAYSEDSYEVYHPVVGDKIYVDRTHTYTEIPEELKGASAIKPANDDKIAEGEEFLSFRVNRPVTLYVAHDDRIEEKPAWLGEFTSTDMEVKTSIESLRLWVREHPAGEIKLGVNGTDKNRSFMYLVFIRASGGTK